MNPTLAAILGPLEGTVFSCEAPETTIGRDTSNIVSLPDPLVSRKHCLIRKEGRQFKIIDLDSHNGVSVNGIPIKKRVLEQGDQILIGDSLFLFLVVSGENLSPVTDESHILTHDLASAKATLLRVEEAMYLNSEKVLNLPQSTRVMRDLTVLLKISRIINTIDGVQPLLQRLLELCLEAVPAECAAILLTGADGSTLRTACTLDVRRDSCRPLQVSRTVVDQVFKDGVSLLSNDVLSREKLSNSENPSGSRICSILCVPLLTGEKKTGVIYFDTSDPQVHFDDGHLQLTTAIAGIAAIALDHELRRESLFLENQRLRAYVNKDRNMVGECPAITKVYEMISRVAPTNSTVLLRGESGTGKELVASALHMNSSRASKPFVAINCAVLSESLLESELFGHEKGAFTGAIAQKKGKLEIADGGTVFLDEISEMAPALQTKLLRVLEEREFQRLGGIHPVHVNVRWIAATNQNLEECVKAKTFREDLYFRLNVVTIFLPPLRERREDISLLADYFLMKYGREFHRPGRKISPIAMKHLGHYDWPGNIRELENVIQRALILSSSDEILPEDLPENLLGVIGEPEASHASYHDAIQAAKKRVIQEALEQSGGNYNQAAKLLGLHPVYLYRVAKNLKFKEK